MHPARRSRRAAGALSVVAAAAMVGGMTGQATASANDGIGGQTVLQDQSSVNRSSASDEATKPAIVLVVPSQPGTLSPRAPITSSHGS